MYIELLVDLLHTTRLSSLDLARILFPVHSMNRHGAQLKKYFTSCHGVDPDGALPERRCYAGTPVYVGITVRMLPLDRVWIPSNLRSFLR